MKTLALLSALGLVLAIPTAPSLAQDNDTLTTRTAKGGRTVVSRTRASQPCALCFTCGGNWPHFGGDIPLGVNRQVQEFGSNCSSPLTTRTDDRPFLCCKGRN
jgi:hypothetical protein